MTLLIRAKTAITDTSRKKYRPDTILTDGSLMLVEPGHPVSVSGGFSSAMMADSAAIPNIAYKEAIAAGAATTESDAKPTWKQVNVLSALAKFERSTKGGVHGIVTQSAYTSQGNFYGMVNPNQGLINYFAANPTHNYYVGVWGKVTRPHLSVGDSQALELWRFARFSSGVIGLGLNSFTGGIANSATWPADYPQAGGNRLGIRKEGLTVAGSTFANLGTLPTDTMVASNYTADGNRFLAGWGSLGFAGVATGAAVINKWASWVWYRTYIEDLTVSGRSYSTVDGIDYGQYTKHVKTVNGRYYGDTTPTAPSALA